MSVLVQPFIEGLLACLMVNEQCAEKIYANGVCITCNPKERERTGFFGKLPGLCELGSRCVAVNVLPGGEHRVTAALTSGELVEQVMLHNSRIVDATSSMGSGRIDPEIISLAYIPSL